MISNLNLNDYGSRNASSRYFINTTWFCYLQESSLDGDGQQKQMRRAFRMVAGEDMEVDAYELQDIMNGAFQRGIKIHL